MGQTEQAAVAKVADSKTHLVKQMKFYIVATPFEINNLPCDPSD